MTGMKTRKKLLPVLAMLMAVVVLAACQPVPKARYDTLSQGDTAPTVLTKLGISDFTETNITQFGDHGTIHTDQVSVYRATQGLCTQTITLRFASYSHGLLPLHFLDVNLRSWNVVNSIGCQGIVL
jgi:hypothetical protein